MKPNLPYRMEKRERERLVLEGNSVFQDLRLERDVLLEMLEALAAWLEHVSREGTDPVATRIGAKSNAIKARAAIAKSEREVAR